MTGSSKDADRPMSRGLSDQNAGGLHDLPLIEGMPGGKTNLKEI